MSSAEYMSQYYLKHKEKMKADRRENYKKNKHIYLQRNEEWRRMKPDAWKYRHIKKYGLTIEEYEAMKAKTNNTCYICGNPPKKRALAIDHNHRTGKVRGLLCWRCNKNLISDNGDKPESYKLYLKAAEYLKQNDN